MIGEKVKNKSETLSDWKLGLGVSMAKDGPPSQVAIPPIVAQEGDVVLARFALASYVDRGIFTPHVSYRPVQLLGGRARFGVGFLYEKSDLRWVLALGSSQSTVLTKFTKVSTLDASYQLFAGGPEFEWLLCDLGHSAALSVEAKIHAGYARYNKDNSPWDIHSELALMPVAGLNVFWPGSLGVTPSVGVVYSRAIIFQGDILHAAGSLQAVVDIGF